MKIVPLAYLASYLLSMLGNSIAAIALPLIVLQVTGSVLGAGTLAAATAIPAILAGLLMGVVIDRINRRTSSVVTDLVSAASVAALPVIDLVSGLNLGWFIACGIIGAIGDVPGLTARDALLPAVVRHGGVSAERLMGVREAIGAIALLLGPAAAGTLMVLFEGSTVLWITAATSLSAALITLLIPHRVGTIVTSDGTPAVPVAGAATARGAWTAMRAGWRALFRNPFLSAVTLLGVVSVVVLAALQGLILPVHFTRIGEPGLLGFVLTALAAGMLVGGAVYATAGTRGRRRVWFVTGLVGTGAGFALIAPLSSVAVVLAGAFVVGLSSSLSGGLLGVLMVERVPEELRGRIMGTQNAIMTGAPAAGILGAAVLTELITVDVAVVVLAGLWLIALAIGLTARSLRRLEPVPEPGTREAGVAGDA